MSGRDHSVECPHCHVWHGGLNDTPCSCEGVVQRVHETFTEEALKENDGKKVPLTKEIGGPVIGEATLRYDPERKALMADFRVDDPDVAEFLRGPSPSVIFRNER